MANNEYEKLTSLLEKEKFPLVYNFKFIVLNNKPVIDKVLKLPGNGASVDQRLSKNGKYISITFKELMPNVDSIIERYKLAAKIEGIMSL